MATKKTFNFAQAYEEVEAITQWFDGDQNIDLDEGLKKFERGLELSSELKKKLEEVENKVEEIKLKFES